MESALHHENRILREKLGHKRILLNDAQKRCLAEAAAKLGRDLLRQFGTLFSPETLLKWQRTLVARKYDGSDRRGKRGQRRIGQHVDADRHPSRAAQPVGDNGQEGRCFRSDIVGL